jgi:uncharacterized UPF0146 family protein
VTERNRDNVVYGLAHDAWDAYIPAVQSVIEAGSVRRICEVGAGANPSFSMEYVEARGLDYSILDISESELAKAPDGYKKVVADICAPDPAVEGGFDLVFSAMLAEHVRDGCAFHSSVYRLLSDGGTACHFYPTLYALPFVVNRLVPESVAGKILDVLARRDRYQHDKFPALYKWCRGPSRGQLGNFKSVGYEIVEFRAFFGHAYYNRMPALQRMSDAISRMLVRHPIPALTSYAIVMLRRPA